MNERYQTSQSNINILTQNLIFGAQFCLLLKNHLNKTQWCVAVRRDHIHKYDTNIRIQLKLT